MVGEQGADIAVIGGGMVGSAIALGLARAGADTIVIDEGDVAFRAARGNFGLVWTQSKGDGMAAYTTWTKRSAHGFTDFAGDMSRHAGADIGYRQCGGVNFCLDDKEWADREASIKRMHNQGGEAPATMLDRKALGDLMPRTPFGPRVIGASYAALDGHVNPLYLLKGMHAAFRAAGGRFAPGAPVESISPGARFTITRRDGARIVADKVVIAAGVMTTPLARQVGIDLRIHPTRGQVMVTERLRPLLPLAASALRQTEEGGFMIGVSIEHVGLDTGTTRGELARMAARACAVLPPLAAARIVRTWGALRPMTDDGYPAYAQSESCPGAFVASCHSGVTLAAVHAGPLARMIAAGALDESMTPFHPRRFHVHQAAA